MANFNRAVPAVPSALPRLIDKLLMTCLVELKPVELFTCHICDKLYCQKESLTNHLTTHVKNEDNTGFDEEIAGINHPGSNSFGHNLMYSNNGNMVLNSSGMLKEKKSRVVTNPETRAAYLSIRDRIKFESEDTIDAALEATSVKIVGKTSNSDNNNLLINSQETLSNFIEKELPQTSVAQISLKKSYGKLYSCKICKEKFAHQSSLEAHEVLCHEQATHTSNADQAVRSQSVYEDILRQDKARIYRKAPSHVCDFCGNRFISIHELTEHLQTYIIDNRWKCRLCESTFQLKEQLKRHQRVHTDERPYSCDTCNMHFRYYSSFAYHKRKLHMPKIQYPTCDICNKQYVEKINLQRHILFNHMTSGYPCRICKKEYGHPVSLTKHMFTHTNGYPHKCKYCKKIFTQKCYKVRHERLTHEKTYDFECDLCRKKFGRKYHLLRHIVNKACQKPYMCRKCKRPYFKLAVLRKHEKSCKKK